MMKIIGGVFVFTVLLSNVLGGGTGDCPDAKVLSPCECDIGDEGQLIIQCDANGTEIKSVFAKFDKDFNKDFNRTEVVLSALVDELSANTFNGIRFQSITFSFNFVLAKIDPDAFHGSEQFIEDFRFYNLHDKIPQNELLSLLSKFTNLKNIELSGVNLSRIPANSFKGLNNLEKFKIRETKNVTVESKAFADLPDKAVTLEFTTGVQLTAIEGKAFASEKPSSHNLTLVFDIKQDVNEVLDRKALIGAKRPVVLYFDGFQRTRNEYLAEDIFLPFFQDHTGNVIAGEGLNCSDCRNLWIKNHKEIWPRFLDFDYKVVSDRVCMEMIFGHSLDDSRNFKDCHNV